MGSRITRLRSFCALAEDWGLSRDVLSHQAAFSNDAADRFSKRLACSLIPYQAIKGSDVARQGIIPGGFPPHLSSLLPIIRWVFLFLRLRPLRFMSGSQRSLPLT